MIGDPHLDLNDLVAPIIQADLFPHLILRGIKRSQDAAAVAQVTELTAGRRITLYILALR